MPDWIHWPWRASVCGELQWRGPPRPLRAMRVLHLKHSLWTVRAQVCVGQLRFHTWRQDNRNLLTTAVLPSLCVPSVQFLPLHAVSLHHTDPAFLLAAVQPLRSRPHRQPLPHQLPRRPGCQLTVAFPAGGGQCVVVKKAFVWGQLELIIQPLPCHLWPGIINLLPQGVVDVYRALGVLCLA